MLNTLREGKNKVEKENSKPDVPMINEDKDMNFIEQMDYLMSRNEKKKLNEETDSKSEKEFVITKSTPQFGDVYTSQEETLKKTIGEAIDLGEKALVFYPKTKDLVLSGKIKSMNVAFQYRFSDPSGDGIYIWANGLQLTESNSRTLGKVRDAFVNWKQALVQNGDLLDKLYKVATKE